MSWLSSTNSKVITSVHNNDLDSLMRIVELNPNSINAKDKYGDSALCVAINKRYFDIARYLIQKKAKVKSKTQNIGPGFVSSMHLGQFDIASYLLRDTVVLSDAARSYLNIALLHAVNRNAVDMAALLLMKGANASMESPDGWPVINLASYNSHTAMVELLLTCGANVNAKTNSGDTALIQASIAGKTDICKLLLEKGVAVNVSNKFGLTALIGASMYGYRDVVEMLLQYGSDANMTDHDGKSALHYAIKYHCNEEAIVCLIQHGGNIELLDENQRTPFDYAGSHRFTAPVILTTLRNKVYSRKRSALLLTLFTDNHQSLPPLPPPASHDPISNKNKNATRGNSNIFQCLYRRNYDAWRVMMSFL